MTTNKQKQYIIIGKLGKLHGIQGWLNLYSDTHPKNAILEYDPLYLEQQPKIWEKLNIDAIKPHGNHFLIHIKNLNTPEAAQAYTNKNIAILREQLPPLPADEYYWSDLCGLTVINQNNIILGVIDHLIATGKNDVMVVIGPKEHLIPFLRHQVILEIDLEAKIMRVDWDEDF